MPSTKHIKRFSYSLNGSIKLIMKKYILLLIMLVIGLSTYAQKGAAVKLPLAVGDTIADGGTVSKYIPITGGYNGTSIQVVLTKLSGTGAGTVQLQNTLDGTNYVNIGSAYTITNTTTQSQIFYLTSPLAGKIKILCTGSGTESVKVAVWYRTPIFQAN
jgi:hypothetical protein